MAFSALISKPGRLTGSELLFVRSHLGLTQLQFSKQVGLANHCTTALLSWQHHKAVVRVRFRAGLLNDSQDVAQG